MLFIIKKSNIRLYNEYLTKCYQVSLNSDITQCKFGTIYSIFFRVAEVFRSNLFIFCTNIDDTFVTEILIGRKGRRRYNLCSLIVSNLDSHILYHTSITFYMFILDV